MEDEVVNFSAVRALRPTPAGAGDRVEQLLERVCAALEESIALQRRILLRENVGAAGRVANGLTEPAVLGLSPAERALLDRVLAGLSNKEIAGERCTSVKTVKGQLTGVYKKLGVTGRTRLLARAR